MKNDPYYFGCAPGRAGHYLFGPNLTNVSRRSSLFPYADLFNMMDGVLVPKDFPPYKVIITYLEGIKYKVFSFVDYSTDKRSGSNANFFIPAYMTGCHYAEDFKKQVLDNFPVLALHYAQKKIEFTFDEEEGVLIFTS